jgi:chemotaxis protein CheC
MDRLTKKYIDVLSELFNIGVGASASILNELLQSHIQLKSPMFFTQHKNDTCPQFEYTEKQNISTTKIKFQGDFEGYAIFMLPKEENAALTFEIYRDLIHFTDIQKHQEDALKEVSNIVLNSIMGTLSNITATHFHYTTPEYGVKKFSVNILDHWIKPGLQYIVLNSSLYIEEIDGHGIILLLFSEKSMDAIMKLLNQYMCNKGIEIDVIT